MKSRILVLLAVGLLAGPMAANAALITRTYQGEAGGFTGPLIPPYPTVQFAFTMTFDPDVSLGKGFIDDYAGTLKEPDYGPWLFGYNSVSKRMAIGDNCLSPPNCSFSLSGNDAVFELDLTDFDNPLLRYLVFRGTGILPPQYEDDLPETKPFSDFLSSTETVASVDGIGTQVPTPATLALFSIGLAGLGWSRRKRV